MNPKEQISVYVCIKEGKTVCICKRSRKRCSNPYCQPDVVQRDNYAGWRDTFRQNKYGK